MTRFGQGQPSSLDYEIRTASVSDIVVLEADLPITDAIFRHRWLISQQDSGTLDYVVAWVSGHPVGRGVILWDGYVIPALREVFLHTPVIRSVEVLEDFRKMGIGTAIVHELELRATRRGFDGVSLGVTPENRAARRLWHQLGYEEWDRGTFHAVSEYQVSATKVVARHEFFIPMYKRLKAVAGGTR